VRVRRKRFIVGISGASGAPYACRLIEVLLADPSHEVHVVVTAAGMRVLTSEADPVARAGPGSPEPNKEPSASNSAAGHRSPLFNYLNLTPEQAGRVVIHPPADIGAGPASGTFPATAMIVVPCSMNTLGAVAHGISNNLLTRAAAVTLKEGRPLILVPRETPFTLIDLRNMTAIAEAGGVILPANPGFYHRPKSAGDLVDYVVQKIMDRLGLDYPDPIRWGEPGAG